jgi:membrane-associated phospholipid phosphatase
MPKLLVIAAWPVGLALILGVGALLAWRAAAPETRQGSLPRFLTGGGNRGIIPGRAQVIQYVLLWIGSAVVLYAVMAAVGVLVVHGGPAIDKPIWHWTVHNRAHSWLALMKYATQVGYKWTTWGAAITGAVLLTFIWPRNRWIPAVAIISLIFTEHFVTIALNMTFNRPGPPGSHGTFPSGGTDRAFAIYGLLAYLLWREVSRRRTGAIIGTTVVAALGFNEAYSRLYLAVHWFTDVLSGILWGCLLGFTFIIIVRLVAGPVGAPEDAALAPRNTNRPQVGNQIPA